jgi:chromate transport protein ChrA
MKEKKPSNNRLLYQYMSFATQLIVSLGIAVYVGLLADRWIKAVIPLLVWILPLIVLITLIVKVIKDTSKK